MARDARRHGLPGAALVGHVEHCLRRATLCDAVRDVRMTKDGIDLSGRQQQRRCIGRALSPRPEVLLMDEPTGSIDPIAATAIGDLLLRPKVDHSILVMPHSTMEARRISGRAALLHLGRLAEVGPTGAICGGARSPEARAFIAGRIG